MIAFIVILELLAIFACELRIKREVNRGRTSILVVIEVKQKAKVRIKDSQ